MPELRLWTREHPATGMVMWAAGAALTCGPPPCRPARLSAGGALVGWNMYKHYVKQLDDRLQLAAQLEAAHRKEKQLLGRCGGAAAAANQCPPAAAPTMACSTPPPPPSPLPTPSPDPCRPKPPLALAGAWAWSRSATP